MRIGLCGARADRTGLAVQTHAFWRNMKPAATLLIDFTRYGFKPNLDWYAGDPNATLWDCPGYEHSGKGAAEDPDPVVDAFLEKVDVVFCVETPYTYYLFERAREMGVKTVLQPNYEFLEYLVKSDLPEPDVFGLPTPWHEEEIRNALPGREIVNLPVPIETDRLTFRIRTEIKTVLHTAGNVAQTDRAGTQCLLEAMRRVKSPVKGIIHSQRFIPEVVDTDCPDNVDLRVGPVDDYSTLYAEGDLFVLPRRYGGLCLPMQEAMGCGMPVLMTDASPQDSLIAKAMRVPVTHGGHLQTRGLLDLWDANPQDVADRIDGWYDVPTAFRFASFSARNFAAQHSWKALKPLYEEVLTDV